MNGLRAEWQKRAGEHCEQVHHAIVEQGNVKSQHIQADEIRAKGRKLIIWIALAIDVQTRLWMAGKVGTSRDRTLRRHVSSNTFVCAVNSCKACSCAQMALQPIQKVLCVHGRPESKKDSRSWKMLLRGLG